MVEDSLLCDGDSSDSLDEHDREIDSGDAKRIRVNATDREQALRCSVGVKEGLVVSSLEFGIAQNATNSVASRFL